jgi:hypothetical protein
VTDYCPAEVTADHEMFVCLEPVEHDGLHRSACSYGRCPNCGGIENHADSCPTPDLMEDTSRPLMDIVWGEDGIVRLEPYVSRRPKILDAEEAALRAELAVRTAERDSAIDVGGTRLEQLAAAQARIAELDAEVANLKVEGGEFFTANEGLGAALVEARARIAELEDTLDRLIEVPEPGDMKFRVGQWSTCALPDQEDLASHAVQPCECGDWEEGSFDPRCAARFEWRWAIVHDEGAHGESFVRWLTDYEVGEWEQREAQP